MPLHPPLLWGLPGGWESLIILVVVLIFFGNRIPGMARALGSGINEFKSGLKEGESDKGKGTGKDTGDDPARVHDRKDGGAS